MDILLDNISLAVIFATLFLIVYAGLLNIYFIYKNGFHISVNCWFCNKNSKVLHSKRNSFECPFCFQYNGFTKDGDYNKVIQAQHQSSLNIHSFNQKTGHSTPKLSNGLCDSCNRNQELKVIQLAKYEALHEKNYDAEIKHFEAQLEKTYGLCKTCSKTVKNTLRKQSAWIFGKRLKSLKNLKSSKHLFLSKSSQGSQGADKFYHNLSVIRLILLVLSLFNLSKLCGLHVFLPKDFLPETLLPSNVILSDIYSSIYNFSATTFGSRSFIIYFPKVIKLQESSTLYTSILGLFAELLSIFTESRCGVFVKCNKLFSWVVLGLVSSLHFKTEIELYFRTLELFCSLYLTYIYSSTCIEFKSKRSDKFHLKRIKREEDCSDNDESDSDVLSSSRISYQTAKKRSPIINSNGFDKSFESVKSTLKNTVLSNTTANNVELNKHFNELNIGAFDCNITRDNQRPLSPNPFLNRSIRPQSPTSLYNYNPSSSFLNQSQQRSLFSQNSNVNNINNITSNNSNEATQFFNQTRRTSPVSLYAEPISLQNKSGNLIRQPSTSFLLKNNYNHSDLFLPRDTSSVISQNITTTKSPTYKLRSTRQNVSSSNSASHEPLFNNTFRPLSPSVVLERPSRSFLSPSKLNNINSFHSDGKENGCLSMSFHTDGPTLGIWPNINGSHSHQRFVVNSLSNITYNSPLNNSLADFGKSNNSRSSSTSSGFISNGDFNKGLSRSLPNSRENSPERTSLLSEPVYT